MRIDTANGPVEIPDAEIARIVLLEDRPDAVVLHIVGEHQGVPVARWQQRWERLNETPTTVQTTYGDLPKATPGLTRKLGFTENDNEVAIDITWMLGDELVRRDVHLVLKRAGAEAGAVAGGVA